MTELYFVENFCSWRRSRIVPAAVACTQSCGGRKAARRSDPGASHVTRGRTVWRQGKLAEKVAQKPARLRKDAFV